LNLDGGFNNAPTAMTMIACGTVVVVHQGCAVDCGTGERFASSTPQVRDRLERANEEFADVLLNLEKFSSVFLSFFCHWFGHSHGLGN
jgi:hypothetical protein